MKLPVNAKVRCKDKDCGRSTYVLVNPVTKQVTHLVVRAMEAPHDEYLVPIAHVVASTDQTIDLDVAAQDLAAMEPFVHTDYVEEPYERVESIQSGGPLSIPLYWPYVIPDRTMYVPVERVQIPPGEMAIHRGAPVYATDGYAGRVEEFILDPTGGGITHLVVREGHLWGRRDLSVSVGQIEAIEDNTVRLKLDKDTIGNLPEVPIRRSK